MQVLSKKNACCRRIIAMILAFVFVFCFIPHSVSAADYPDYLQNFETFFVLQGGFWDFMANVYLGWLSDGFWGGDDDYYMNAVLDASLYDCSGSPTGVHQFPSGSSNYRNRACIYCGMLCGDLVDATKGSYDDYVSTLPAGLNASSTGVTAYGVGFVKDNSDNSIGNAYWQSFDLYSLFNSNDSGFLLMCSGYYSYMGLFLGYDGYGNHCINWRYIDEVNPYTSINYPLGTLLNGFDSYDVSSLYIYCSYSDAYSAWLSLGTTVYFLTPDSYVRFRNSPLDRLPACSFNNLGCITQSGSVSFDISNYFIGAGLPRVLSTFSFIPGSYSVSDIYDSTSRVSSLTQSISKYNSGNNWVDNSTTVNYFIGTVGEDGTVSGVYDMSIFDEDTLIFTEPVTGAQYQTSGWTYDYMTRSYDIDVESGTFAIGDSDITRIVCTYGDDFVTIAYYDSSGSVIQTDEYVYVMGSQSACSLSGHSYTVETAKEASCTGTGERVYTCSVCGDQKVEDIPMKQHSSTYSVFKDATCIDSGVALYTCSTCGTQYTETIDALGHDWISVDGTDTSYALPEGTSCPACSGADYTCELDEASSTYSCTCNSCGTSWTAGAVVTSGYTKYECTRCGVTKTEYDVDDGDGLFQSIGNFFANGLTWCFDKLTQLVEGLAGILDTFNSYVNVVMDQGGEFAGFLGSAVGLLPEDLMAVIWFGVVAFVLVAVILFWLK